MLPLKAPALGGLPYYHVPRVGPPLLESNEPAGGKSRAAGAIFLGSEPVSFVSN